MEVQALEALVTAVHASGATTIPLEELLAFSGRSRATKAAWAEVNSLLSHYQLEAHRPTTGGNWVHVYRRDSALAAILEAVSTVSPEGESLLQRFTSPPLDDDDKVHNLVELLAYRGCSSLDCLTDSICYGPDNAAVSLYGEDPFSNSHDHGRLIGVNVGDGTWSFHFRYPFDPSDLSEAADELEHVRQLEDDMESLYNDDCDFDESEPDPLDPIDAKTVLQYMYVADVCCPTPGWMRGSPDSHLELVSRDEDLVVLARFLPTREVLFRLTPEDVEDLEDRVRVVTRDKRQHMRVAASIDDDVLLGDLLLRAAGKHTK